MQARPAAPPDSHPSGYSRLRVPVHIHDACTGSRVGRRPVLAAALALLWGPGLARAQLRDAAAAQAWYAAALEMRRLALSWGDQPYGAVVVKDGRIIGHGPSRVVKDGNPDAHAEREAIKDAIARLGAGAVRGSLLVSTSRPCALCEQAAARSGVARMYFGEALADAGVPQGPP